MNITQAIERIDSEYILLKDVLLKLNGKASNINECQKEAEFLLRLIDEDNPPAEITAGYSFSRKGYREYEDGLESFFLDCIEVLKRAAGIPSDFNQKDVDAFVETLGFKVSEIAALIANATESDSTKEEIYKLLTGREPTKDTFPPQADAPTGQQGKDQAAPEDEKKLTTREKKYLLRIMYAITQMNRLDITDCHTASKIADTMHKLGIIPEGTDPTETISKRLTDMQQIIPPQKKTSN